MKKTSIVAFVLLAVVVHTAVAQNVDILFGVRIPCRDGIRLNATVYKPHDQKTPLPVLMIVTPYIADGLHKRGNYFASHGYVFVSIDSRGRGSSEGVFDPFMQEAKDGYDIVEWLAKQPYCNGKVATWGGSYCGYDQWATAKELPPHLTTMVPTASVKPGVDFPMGYNIPFAYDIQWLSYTSGKTGNELWFGDDGFWKSKFTERYKQDLPFTSLDSLVGNPSPTFQKWVAHPLVDAYVKSFNPSPEQYARMTLPILTITGCYDGDQPGALDFYREFMQYASPAEKDKHYLIIGPWDHPGTRTPKKELGGLTFGDASLLDMNDLHRQWYNYTMNDSARPSFLKNKVAYFITNKDQWKYVSSLEEIGKTKLPLYLNSGNASSITVLHSAYLQASPVADGRPAQYTYDPLDKRFADSTRPDNPNYLLDQAAAFELRDAGVVYHSEPFEKDREVSGFFGLDLYIEADVKDVDVDAQIYEIKENGTSVLLTDNTVRARYRESLEKEKLLAPGEINLFRFQRFTFISRVIEKGSRLRLVLTSPNGVYYQKNYCSGGVVARETARDAHVAHIKIYNDSKHPSVLWVPVMP